MEQFRLLDLAPELRNRIYQFALIQNRFEDEFANLALLRVSKEVYREAIGIFWSQATFCISILNLRYQSARCSSAPMPDTTTGDFRSKVYNSKLNSFADCFPSAVLNVARIEIEVDAHRPEFASHLLCALASTLHRSNSRHQDISIKIKSEVYEAHLESQIAYPLLKMAPHVNIFFESSDKKGEQEAHARYLDGNKVKKTRPAYATFDAPVEMKRLRPKIKVLLAKQPSNPDTQGVVLAPTTSGERKLIPKMVKKAKDLLETNCSSGPITDRALMACVSALARWVEMRESGMRVDDEELVKLKKYRAAIYENGTEEQKAFNENRL